MKRCEVELKAGVVGVGSIGRNHARVYSELDCARLVAVHDVDERAAQEIGRKHGAGVCRTLDEFAERVELASVATPTPTHFGVARALLARGVHVLVEKPVTSTALEAEELVKLAQTNGCVLQVGHIERFNPVLGVLEDRLTRPRFIEAHRLSAYPGRSLDIGVVLDLMIHDLEIILHLVKSPVRHIDAVGIPVLSASEDIANARLRFEDGCVANVTASRVSPEKMRKIRVFQEDAYLSLDYEAQQGKIYTKANGTISIEKVQAERAEPLKLELAAFAECCRRGAQPRVSGQAAARALELALEITQIARSSADPVLMADTEMRP